MNQRTIAVQLYTLRDFTKTPADFSETIQRVKGIGFQAVELAGTAGLSPAEAAKIVRDAGLQISSSHESPKTILENPHQIVDRLGQFGITHAVYPWPDGIDFADTRQVDNLMLRLDAAGAVLHQAGMTLCYHNHALEFYRHKDRTVLETIFANIPPEHLQAELDIHWIQAGGRDPAETCRQLSGRLPLLHVKDYVVTATGDRRFAEVGYGNLPIHKILTAAEEAGCQQFIVEQDDCDADPFECIERSLKFLKALGDA